MGIMGGLYALRYRQKQFVGCRTWADIQYARYYFREGKREAHMHVPLYRLSDIEAEES